MDRGNQPARKPAPEPVVLALQKATEKKHGGARLGAGRKPGLRPIVLHRERGEHRTDLPVLITLRRASATPSLRSERIHRILRESVRATEPLGFRIVRYSIDDEHMHLVVEADNAKVLSTAMRSFIIRAAVLVNYALHGRRQGRVWTKERYRIRELGTPCDVRRALERMDGDHGEGVPPRTWLLREGWRRPTSELAPLG